MTGNAITVICAFAGAAAGYFLFLLMLSQGFYALVLPGGLAGIAAGFAHCRSLWVPVVCAAIAFGAGLAAEMLTAPFVADPSPAYFLRHLTELRPLTMILIVLGAIIGFYGPYRGRAIRSR